MGTAMKESGIMGHSMHWARGMTHYLLLLALFQLTACNGPMRTTMSPAECDKLLETSTRAKLYSQLADLQRLTETISATYHVPLNVLTVDDDSLLDGPGPDVQLQWEARSSDGLRAYSIRVAGNELDTLEIGYRGHLPTVNDFLLCLGAPTTYFAWYGFGAVRFQMFFPQQGLITFSSEFAQFPDTTEETAPIPMDVARLPVHGIHFSPPMTADAQLVDSLNDMAGTNLEEEPIIDPIN